MCKTPTCVANCLNKQCGDDGCGGKCGICPTFYNCNENSGSCERVCIPRCYNKQCGDDGCGGNCGECGEGLVGVPLLMGLLQ